MNWRPLFPVAAILTATLLLAGCTQAAPAPAPTKPAAAPTNAQEPTKAATAVVAPTAAPTAVPKVDFPAKDKVITFIVPWAAGGAADVGARLLAPGLEAALGVPVQVVNKAGASGQVGLTELVGSKPDGYTIGLTIFASTITTYLDPERKAVFTRDSFTPVALQVSDPAVICVPADSPYKTLKDVIDAAKAKPQTIGSGTGGLMTTEHLALLQLEQATSAKLKVVHFNGSAEAMTSLLGGHVESAGSLVSQVAAPFKSQQIRVLGVFDKEPNKFLPGAPTAESQGYRVYSGAFRGIAVPAGTPKGVVDMLSAAAKKAMESDEMKRKMEETAQGMRYMDAAQYAALWAETEAQIKPLMTLAR